MLEIACPDEVMEVNRDTPELLRHLREKVILPPSELPYHLHSGAQHDPSDGQSVIIDKLLGGKVSYVSTRVEI